MRSEPASRRRGAAPGLRAGSRAWATWRSSRSAPPSDREVRGLRPPVRARPDRRRRRHPRALTARSTRWTASWNGSCATATASASTARSPSGTWRSWRYGAGSTGASGRRTTRAGELVAKVMAAVAQRERRAIGQRTREGLAAKKTSAFRLGRPPVLPLLVVRRIVREREQGMTLQVIADGLTASGVLPLAGDDLAHVHRLGAPALVCCGRTRAARLVADAEVDAPQGSRADATTLGQQMADASTTRSARCVDSP